MIGAGFASGREISLYFASSNIFTLIIGAAFCGLFCFIFAEVGRISGGTPLQYTLGEKYGGMAESVIRLTNIVTFCAMLAACEYVIKVLIGTNGGTVFSAVLCLLVIFLGEEKMKTINAVSLPLIVILIAVILFKSGEGVPDFKEFRLLSPIMYASMNILSSGYLIASMSKDNTPSDSVKTSVITTLILTFLMVAIYISIQKSFDKVMPLLHVAENLGLKIAACLLLYLSIFTTLTGSLLIASKKKTRPALLITSLSLVVASFGFQRLVDFFYPIIGVIGAILTAVTAFKLFRHYTRPSARKVSIGNFDVCTADKSDD